MTKILQKILLLTKISLSNHNIYFGQNSVFIKIYIFGHNFNFWRQIYLDKKILFLTILTTTYLKILEENLWLLSKYFKQIFLQNKIYWCNFDFWRIFNFFTKISIFTKILSSLQKFRFFMKKLIFFYKNFDFLRKLRFFTKILIFFTKISFFIKISYFSKISSFSKSFQNLFWRKISIFCART